MDDSDPAADADGRPHGLFDSLKELAASIVGVAHDRLDLLGTEMEEQAARLATLLVWGVVALSLTLATLLLGVMALIVIFWDTHRVLVAAGSALLFGVLAAVAIYELLSLAKARPRSFAATLDELCERPGAPFTTMTSRVQEIASRRRALVARAAQQRERVARKGAMVRRSLWLAELGVRGCQYFRARPLFAVGLIAALVVLGPRRMLGTGYRGALLALSLVQLGSSLKKTR